MTFDSNILSLMLEDMETAPEAFRPTNFWNSGLTSIMDDIKAHGIETFRSHPSAAFFYVPVYGSKTQMKWGHILNPIIDRLSARKQKRYRMRLTHSDRARADYRLFSASLTPGALDLGSVSESEIGGGERFEFEGRSYSRSMLNYLRALTLLQRTLDTSTIKSCLEIGGGYGTLGEILHKSQDGAFYVNVDIPPVAAVSTYYLSELLGAENVLDYSKSRDMDVFDLDELSKRYKAVVLCPWQLPQVKGQCDLFANFMSFQEMEPAIVANYLSLVQPLTRQAMLLRNTAVGKKIAAKKGDIGVFEQVTSGYIVDQLDQFTLQSKNSFVNGELSDDGKYNSEVTVLTRKA